MALNFSRLYQELLATETHVYFNSLHNQLKFLESIQLHHFSSVKFLENQPLLKVTLVNTVLEKKLNKISLQIFHGCIKRYLLQRHMCI